MKTEIITSRYASPAGELTLGAAGGRICLCDWVGSRRAAANARRIGRFLDAGFTAGTCDAIRQAAAELDEYFAGTRVEFSVEMLLAGTEFQRRIWTALTEIRYGETISYAELARRVGCPQGVRAVASAVGANALSILLPCHRVVGANGDLTGYAGGFEAKSQLLELELRKKRVHLAAKYENKC